MRVHGEEMPRCDWPVKDSSHMRLCVALQVRREKSKMNMNIRFLLITLHRESGPLLQKRRRRRGSLISEVLECIRTNPKGGGGALIVKERN